MTCWIMLEASASSLKPLLYTFLDVSTVAEQKAGAMCKCYSLNCSWTSQSTSSGAEAFRQLDILWSCSRGGRHVHTYLLSAFHARLCRQKSQSRCPKMGKQGTTATTCCVPLCAKRVGRCYRHQRGCLQNKSCATVLAQCASGATDSAHTV